MTMPKQFIKPRFLAAVTMSQIVITQGALIWLEKYNVDAASLIKRHANCDWGNLSDFDKRQNDEAIEVGHRVLSSYEIGDGRKVWIITEWDRSATTVLLPEEY